MEHYERSVQVPDTIAPENLTDHPWMGDEDGHNCRVCKDRDDPLHLCWRESHPSMWGPAWEADEILDYSDEPSKAIKTDRVRQAGQG